MYTLLPIIRRETIHTNIPRPTPCFTTIYATLDKIRRSLWALIRLLPHTCSACPVPHVSAPADQTFTSSSRAVNGGPDIQEENRLTRGFFGSGVVIDHVSNFLALPARTGPLNEPVVPIEGRISAVVKVSLRARKDNKPRDLQRTQTWRATSCP